MMALLSLCKLVCNSLSFPASFPRVWQLDKCVYLTVDWDWRAHDAHEGNIIQQLNLCFFQYEKKRPKYPYQIDHGVTTGFSISIIHIISFQQKDNHGQKQHLSQAAGGPHQGQSDCWSTQESAADLISLCFLAFNEIVQTDGAILLVSATSVVLFFVSSRECERKDDKVHFQWASLTGRLEILIQQRCGIKKKARITVLPSVRPAETKALKWQKHPHHLSPSASSVPLWCWGVDGLKAKKSESDKRNSLS